MLLPVQVGTQPVEICQHGLVEAEAPDTGRSAKPGFS